MAMISAAERGARRVRISAELACHFVPVEQLTKDNYLIEPFAWHCMAKVAIWMA